MESYTEAETVSYKGRRIIYLNYKGKKEEEIIETMDMIIQNMPRWCEGGGKEHLLLVNMLNSYTTPPVAEKVKQLARISKPFVKKGAVVMTSKPTTRIIFGLINRIAGDNRKMFQDEETAKEWLVTD